jgi:hypothetical protein
MIYTMDERQLLRMWSVIHCFAAIRDTRDPIVRDKILTNAQILLTAFVLDLTPLSGEQAGSTPPAPRPERMVRFDA